MHHQTIQEIYKTLNTTEHGLTSQTAAARLEEIGPNIIEKKKKKPLIFSFLEELTDLMVVILIVAAVISGAAGETKDAAVILFIVVLNATIGFIQKFKAEKALEALQKMLSPHAKVMRDGKVQEIPASQLVPGDIVLLSEGDKVPADCRLMEENELEVDESALTGESVPVAKQIETITEKNIETSEKNNMVFMGTSVTHGTGKLLVVLTGMNTEFGKIAYLTQTTSKEKSPLQKELFKMGIFVGKVTIGLSALLFAAGWLWQDKPFMETFLFATSVAVAAVPEGLPATVTIALAIGVQRMAKKNSIIKKLASVETLGCTTVICSDKTGTLTKNQMTVVQAYFDGHTVSIEGTGYNPKGKWHTGKQNSSGPTTLQKLCEMATLCNNAKLHEQKAKIGSANLSAGFGGIGGAQRRTGPQLEKNESWKIIGDPTEGALLVATSKTDYHPDFVLKDYRRLQEFPFDSARKMMTTIDEEKLSGKVKAHLKGAPDEVLKICTHVYENGKIIPLTPELKGAIQTANEQMANQALRVLAFAEKSLEKNAETSSPNKKAYSKETVEAGMVFVGLMGMIDPPRPEVYQAVKMAHEAGIKIYMVTGDYGPTAVAIGKDLKIVQGKNVESISGHELNSIDEHDLAKLLRDKTRQIVFARVSPEHKLKIVNALKQNGEIVAMTGDGVNDAPALKKADIGVAMGITGTDVSKEAADMVLVDDSFETIVASIEEGRTIYNNLKKFVFYIFSCNIGELTTVFIAILVNLPQPLTAILILAVNLGTDVFPALALGVDPSEPGLMKKPPRSNKEQIMKKNFVTHFLFIGITIGVIVTLTYFWMLHRYGWRWGNPLENESLTYLKASSAAFALLVFIQMANAFNVRHPTESLFKKDIFKNRWLLGAITLSILTVVAFIQVPYFQGLLQTTSLSMNEWALLGIASLSICVVEEMRKGWVRYRHKNHAQ